MKTRKSWREKLANSKDLPRVTRVPDRMKNRWGEGTLVIPAPIEVDKLMRRVPRGRVTTVNQLRAALAKQHKATIAAWIAANAADETLAERPNARVTPYWRTLKAGGVLNEKYPGGVSAQRARLRAEGHEVVRKGKHFVVAGAEEAIFNFD